MTRSTPQESERNHDDGTPATDARPAAKEGGTASVLAAIAANVGVGVVKFVAAAITGSSAMVSEGVHSIVDSGNGLLVLLGLKRARKAPTIEHPFGFGKELYFWTLVVGVCIFALGGGLSVMQGVHAIQSALAGSVEHGSPIVAFVVLVASMAIEGASLSVAVRQFNRARGDVRPMRYIKDSKDPSLYSVLLEDSAAELGLVLALIGLALTTVTGNAIFDAAASVVIGLLLMAVAIVMLTESKGLLVGEGMTRSELQQARAIVEADPAIERAGSILTMYFGPNSMLMTVDVTFVDDIDDDGIMRATERVEAALRAAFPQATRIYIEAEDLSEVRRQREAQKAMPTE